MSNTLNNPLDKPGEDIAVIDIEPVELMIALGRPARVWPPIHPEVEILPYRSPSDTMSPNE